MHRVWRVISGWRSLSWKDIRRGFSIDFLMTVLAVAMIACFTWGFEIIERLYDRFAMALIPAILPPITFIESLYRKEEERRCNWVYVAFVVFLGLALIIALSDRLALNLLGLYAVVTMVSSPFLVLFFKLIQNKKLLAIGMIPAAMILMALLVVTQLPDDGYLNLLPVSLFAVSMSAAGWTFCVWLFLKGAERWVENATLGPLMESLAMFFLFVPLMTMAILGPRAIPGGEDWSIVTSTVVGVMFGSVVSEPLRRFLVSYGNLPSFPRSKDERD